MSPDPVIFLVLLIILGLSSLIFWVSVRRETHHRAQLRLAEWAEQNRFERMDPELGAPRPLDLVRAVPLSMTIGLFTAETQLVHIRSDPLNPGDAPLHWNLAIRQLANPSEPVGLRATDAERTVTDLFGLEASPRQVQGSRFTIVGDDLIASKRLADGSGAALLPGDISLLRVEHYLLLDFSGRPFDPIELGRMRAMLDQLATVV